MKKLSDLVVRRINEDVDRWVDSFLAPPTAASAATGAPPAAAGAPTTSPDGSRSSTPTGAGAAAAGRCNAHCESGCSTCTQSNNCSRSDSAYNNVNVNVQLQIRNAPSLYSFSGDSNSLCGDSVHGSPPHTRVAHLAAAGGHEWARSSFSRALPFLQRARGLLPSIRVHRSSVNGSLKRAPATGGGGVSPSDSGDLLAAHAAPPRFDDDAALARVLEMFEDGALRLLDPAGAHCKFFAQALNVDYVRSVVLALDLKLHRELHAVITELTQYQTERKDDPQTIMRTSRLSLKLYFAIKKLVASMQTVAEPAKCAPLTHQLHYIPNAIYAPASLICIQMLC